ncbi:MAG TPA: hypothetical protein VF544_13180 [Pyrinomonadaceae bacterium]|jgi:hypothetical protein
MARKQIKVQADRSYCDRFEEVARGLEEAGMTIEQRLMMLGHFRGTAEAEQVERLRAVPGVVAVTVLGDEGDEPRDEYSIKTDES